MKLFFTYLGGVADLPGPIKQVGTHFSEEGVTASYYVEGGRSWVRKELVAGSWGEVRAAVEGTDQIQGRAQVNQWIRIGVFAFTWRTDREEKRSFLVLDTADGDVILQHDELTAHELRAQLAPYLRNTSHSSRTESRDGERADPATTSTTADADTLAQLERLAALHQAGVIDDLELATLKRRVLEST